MESIDDEVVAMVLVGGRGTRAGPITAKAPSYLRSKAAVSICGRRTVQWQLESLRAQGVRRAFVVARGKENRYQTKACLGYGEHVGMEIDYSRSRDDALNTGSADATLRELERLRLSVPALVIPADSLYEFSLAEMLEGHRRSGAIVTVASMVRRPAEVAGKYGLMMRGRGGRITDFVEKPSLEALRRLCGPGSEPAFDAMPLWTNAGMYLVDAARLRGLATDRKLRSQRQRRLDFGMDLLPWLVGEGFEVFGYPAGPVGDMGTISGYLETMQSLLGGGFPSLTPLVGVPFDREKNIWIDPHSLRMRDRISGKTLERKLDEGLVDIGPAVRIGRGVEIGPGVHISSSSIDDGIDIGEGVHIEGSAIRDGVIIGSHAVVADSYLGTMVHIHSSLQRRTVLTAGVGLGDEAVVHEGVQLSGGVAIPPGRKVVSPVQQVPRPHLLGAGERDAHTEDLAPGQIA